MSMKRPPYSKLALAAALAAGALPGVVQAAACSPAGNYVVTSAGDTTADDSVTTLREALSAAAANPNCDIDVITFSLPSGSAGTVTLGSPLYISDHVSIDGGDAGIRLITSTATFDAIQYSTSGASRLELHNIELDGQDLTYTSGYGGLYAFLGGYGGLLLDEVTVHDFNTGTYAPVRVFGGAQVTVSETDFYDNVSTGYGGGLYMNASGYGGINYDFDRASFIGNQANAGGGLYLTGTPQSVEVGNSAFISNSAYQGGGVYVVNSNVTVGNTTLSGNSATEGSGGGVYVQNNGYTLTMYGSTVTANSATSYGGGISGGYEADVTLAGAGAVISGNTGLGDADDVYHAVDAFAPDTSLIGGDAMLGPLRLSQSRVFFHMPRKDSPLVNALEESFGSDYGDTDALGRERGLGGGFDIGAVEYVEQDDAGAAGWGMFGLLAALGLLRRRR